MLWSGISTGGHMNLYIIWNVSLMSKKYKDKIFESFVLTYAGTVSNTFPLMNDNALCHKVCLVKDCLSRDMNIWNDQHAHLT